MNKPLTILYSLAPRTGPARRMRKSLCRRASAPCPRYWTTCRRRSPGHAAAFQNRRTVRAAVNQEFADLSQPIQPGDEVAFFRRSPADRGQGPVGNHLTASYRAFALASDRVAPDLAASAAAMNSSRSPSSTASGFPFSTPVRRSFTN